VKGGGEKYLKKKKNDEKRAWRQILDQRKRITERVIEAKSSTET